MKYALTMRPEGAIKDDADMVLRLAPEVAFECPEAGAPALTLPALELVGWAYEMWRQGLDGFTTFLDSGVIPGPAGAELDLAVTHNVWDQLIVWPRLRGLGNELISVEWDPGSFVANEYYPDPIVGAGDGPPNAGYSLNLNLATPSGATRSGVFTCNADGVPIGGALAVTITMAGF